MIPGFKLFQKARVFTAIFALAKDPERTDRVFSIIDAAHAIARTLPAAERGRYNSLLLAYPGFKTLYESQPCLAAYDLASLTTLPENTLGYRYAKHMQDNDLHSDFYPLVKGADPIDFARLRLPQTHDILHVITGFNTTPAGEFALQAFYLEQLPSTPVPAAILASAFLGALQSEDFDYRESVLAAVSRGYEVGRHTKPILFRRWEDDWARDLNDLRAELSIRFTSASPQQSLA